MLCRHYCCHLTDTGYSPTFRSNWSHNTRPRSDTFDWTPGHHMHHFWHRPGSSFHTPYCRPPTYQNKTCNCTYMSMTYMADTARWHNNIHIRNRCSCNIRTGTFAYRMCTYWHQHSPKIHHRTFHSAPAFPHTSPCYDSLCLRRMRPTPTPT